MGSEEIIRSPEERRRTIKYGYNDVTREYVKDVLRCGPLRGTLVDCERRFIDRKNNASIPSDDAVDELRDWSIVKQV